MKDRLLRSFPARVVRRYLAASGPTWATVIAWNLLFAFFPIVLVAITILGLVMQGAGPRIEHELTLTDRGRHALEEPSEVIPRLLLEESRETVLLIDLTSANGPWFLLPRPPRRPSDDGPDSR